MPRKKGTPNTPTEIIKEIIAKHKTGATRKELAKEYGKPFKSIKAMIWRENRKVRQQSEGIVFHINNVQVFLGITQRLL